MRRPLFNLSFLINTLSTNAKVEILELILFFFFPYPKGPFALRGVEQSRVELAQLAYFQPTLLYFTPFHSPSLPSLNPNRPLEQAGEFFCYFVCWDYKFYPPKLLYIQKRKSQDKRASHMPQRNFCFCFCLFFFHEKIELFYFLFFLDFFFFFFLVGFN